MFCEIKLGNKIILNPKIKENFGNFKKSIPKIQENKIKCNTPNKIGELLKKIKVKIVIKRELIPKTNKCFINFDLNFIFEVLFLLKNKTNEIPEMKTKENRTTV